MILNCAIIDDEPLALDLLENYVGKTHFLKLEGRYSNAVLALEGLQERPVDVVFCDIQMPGLDGLAFAKRLPTDTYIIFTTAFGQYAVDSYRVNAVDYLLKPFSYDDFLMAANKAWRLIEQQRKNNFIHTEPETIFLKSERKLVRVELDHVLYIEAMRDYVKVVLDGDQEPIFSLMSLKSLLSLLPAGRFIRVHRSFLVQKSKIGTVTNSHIEFGRVQIPIGRLYKNDLARFLSEQKH